jgi:hypothetical protein
MSALRPLRLRVVAERTREGISALWRLLGLLEAIGGRLVRRLRFGVVIELPGDPVEVRARLERVIALL